MVRISEGQASCYGPGHPASARPDELGVHLTKLACCCDVNLARRAFDFLTWGLATPELFRAGMFLTGADYGNGELSLRRQGERFPGREAAIAAIAVHKCNHAGFGFRLTWYVEPIHGAQSFWLPLVDVLNAALCDWQARIMAYWLSCEARPGEGGFNYNPNLCCAEPSWEESVARTITALQRAKEESL